MAGRVRETDRHCCVDVAGRESGQTVWQAECWRQTDIAVLMLQAMRVDRQQAGSALQTDIAVLMLQAQRVDREQAGSVLQTDIHCCVDVAGMESGQMVWQAACCCRRCDPTCTSPS